MKLLDFGLVKALRADLALPTATREGTFMGSPAYTSPEQAQGKSVDHRTDIYALGIMIHELVTGRLPFEADGIAELLMKQITARRRGCRAEVLATDLGRALDAIVQTCLAKDPADRALRRAQLADMFRRLAGGERIAPARIRGSRRRAVTSRGRRRAFAVAAAAALAAAALLVGTRGGSARRPSAPTVSIAAAAAAPPAAAPAVTAAADTTVAHESTNPRRARETRLSARPARKSVSRARTLDPYR